MKYLYLVIGIISLVRFTWKTTEEVSAWRKGEESSALGTRRERRVRKVA